ncbi:site-2 protease family protein [Sulfobacillus harzensis]|uniref:Peptidase M50 n=1 Tax=Sulfobacillus harzensis TaxID=2729629 RepID=A0A7Y0L0W3_9FIRM|nr:site-2 protease family protein [Sulfobacillus harzensis]NMP21233.1 peptidase M50 [Sulfobacillus harzensis]
MARAPLWRQVRINPLFLGVLVLYGAAGHGRTMIIAFLAVTLHELTHAVVADLYGLDIERIEIWPFGGMARIPGLDTQDPYVETMVAVAGPLANFFWAAFAWAFQRALPMNPEYVTQFIEANLAIGAINLLPVAPLDGGRLARLYLSRQMGYQESERRVREGGLWLARLLFAAALAMLAGGQLQLGLGIFAAFLYWGAYRTPHHAPYLIIRDLGQRILGFQRRPVWTVEDLAVRGDVALGDVIRVMRPLKYHRVVVLDADMRRMGILYEEALLSGMERFGPELPIAELLSG